MTGLNLNNLHFSRKEFDLSLSAVFPQGSKTLLVGASGAGKSTLLSLIAGFAFPKSGEIIWNGKEITRLSPQERPLTLLFQENNLFPHLTLEKNVALGLQPSLKLSKEESEELQEMLQKVGISHLQQKYPFELSGGERQRAALARSLLRQMPILLLDEPLGPLGPGMRKEMLDLLQKIVEEFKLTLLIPSHHPEEAISIADQMLF